MDKKTLSHYGWIMVSTQNMNVVVMNAIIICIVFRSSIGG